MARYATQAEEDAERVLRGLGFEMRKVEQTSCMTPDFEVFGDSPSYLVEVKSREWSKEILNPPSGLVVSSDMSMTDDGAVGKWLFKSRAQCHAIDPRHERFWFLWCSMEGAAPAEQAERAVRTLYGVRTAYVATAPACQWSVFYSQESAFERFPDIDGAIVVAPPDGLAFCSNEFSPRATAVLSCKLASKLRELPVPFHPPAAGVSSCYRARSIVLMSERFFASVRRRSENRTFSSWHSMWRACSRPRCNSSWSSRLPGGGHPPGARTAPAGPAGRRGAADVAPGPRRRVQVRIVGIPGRRRLGCLQVR